MTNAATMDRKHLFSPRLGFPHRRSAGAGGFRLPQRLVEGSRLFETELRGGLAILRGSRLEAAAPERL